MKIRKISRHSPKYAESGGLYFVFSFSLFPALGSYGRTKKRGRAREKMSEDFVRHGERARKNLLSSRGIMNITSVNTYSNYRQYKKNRKIYALDL